jgi:hypothetical protein
MARGLTDYLKDWDNPSQSGDSRKNASGADSDGGDYEYGNPYRAPMPESPEWGLGPKDATSFGHSDTVKDTGTKSSAWGMSKEDQARGYERPGSGDAGKPGTASFEQEIPERNIHDRGSGSDVRRAEFSSTEGRGFDGRGNDKPSPGREAMGTRPVNT